MTPKTTELESVCISYFEKVFEPTKLVQQNVRKIISGINNLNKTEKKKKKYRVPKKKEDISFSFSALSNQNRIFDNQKAEILNTLEISGMVLKR